MGDADTNQDEKLTNDGVLDLTQRTRKQLVDEMVRGGMPDDNKDRALLLSALSDMDQTAISNKRLNAQERVADKDREAMMAIARVREMTQTANPFRVETEIEGTVVEPDDDKLPSAEPVEGEMEVGISDMSYDTFMKKYDEGH